MTVLDTQERLCNALAGIAQLTNSIRYIERTYGVRYEPTDGEVMFIGAKSLPEWSLLVMARDSIMADFGLREEMELIGRTGG